MTVAARVVPASVTARHHAELLELLTTRAPHEYAAQKVPAGLITVAQQADKSNKETRQEPTQSEVLRLGEIGRKTRRARIDCVKRKLVSKGGGV